MTNPIGSRAKKHKIGMYSRLLIIILMFTTTLIRCCLLFVGKY